MFPSRSKKNIGISVALLSEKMLSMIDTRKRREQKLAQPEHYHYIRLLHTTICHHYSFNSGRVINILRQDDSLPSRHLHVQS